MPYTHRRTCSICGKQDLLKLSDHLRQVHHLSMEDRQPYLKNAMFSTGLPNITRPLETKPYPAFKFQHPATMMVVGPTQSGKSHFVEKLLQSHLIKYPTRKAIRIHVYYTQWQPLYDRLKETHGNHIAFTQGLPEVDDNLESIDSKVNNVWVLDDLMDEAIQSPVISQLFTRGRHRNLTTILLLQNMFPKGKYNTNISRNALYKVLFRSPGDRKQIDIMAEQTFAKDRGNFMKAYAQETDKPFGYIVLDNHSRTTNEHQVVGNVFENCYTYPNITKSESQPVQNSISSEEKTKPTVKKPVKVPFQPVSLTKPAVKSTKKRKVTPPVANKKQKKPKREPVKKKPVKKPSKAKARFTGDIKKPAKQPKERFTGGFVESPEKSETEEPEEYEESGTEDPESPEESETEEFEDYESPESYLERQAYRMARSREGFGPGSLY